MKIRNITIGIKSVEDSVRDFVHAFKTARRGKTYRRPKEGTYFVNLEAMLHVLTPKRLELLHVIRERHPHSIYELAKLAERELKNVQEDVALLSRIGLVSIARSRSARNRVVPKVDYDSLQLQIPVI